MTETNTALPSSQKPCGYEIRVEGYLDECWPQCVGGMSIKTLESGETLLSVMLTDQAALHGLLKKVRDSGMKLLSVNQVSST